MKVHNINIDRKYFEPIREGKITLLIFKTKVLKNASPGDCILASKGNYDIKTRFSKYYIKAFEDITEEEARKAGFLNKEFLKEELTHKYDLNPIFDFIDGVSSIDKELFFLIEIDNTEKERNSFKYVSKPCTVDVNFYSKEYNKEFYNPEYDVKPWRE